MTEKLLGTLFASGCLLLAALLAWLTVQTAEFVELAKVAIWAVTLGVPLTTASVGVKTALAETATAKRLHAEKALRDGGKG